MKIKKIIAGIAAAAVAASMMAVNAFAAVVELDTEFPGAWQLSKAIPTEDLQAIGGDVKIVLTYETYDPIGMADQFVFNPIDAATWTSVSMSCTSDTMVGKTDGILIVQKGTSTCEFVVPGDVIATLGESGLAFQQNNLIIKSADISAGSPQGEIPRLEDKEGMAYSMGERQDPRLDGGAAPAGDGDGNGGGATTSAKTGNASSAAMLSVMAVAGVAAAATKKRK
ncbi:MAG: hypothetical protein J1F11_01800 [Oscillospiraceae bacterium]|nr:hypothetical protein [Oscillospiraceae bacterium]